VTECCSFGKSRWIGRGWLLQ